MYFWFDHDVERCRTFSRVYFWFDHDVERCRTFFFMLDAILARDTVAFKVPSSSTAASFCR